MIIQSKLKTSHKLKIIRMLIYSEIFLLRTQILKTIQLIRMIKKRKDFYIKNGYELLVISDTEFNRQKKPNTVVDKCLNFLKK